MDQNFLQLLGTVPEGLRNALLLETDHIFSFGEEGETETYHLSRRHFSIGPEPHTYAGIELWLGPSGWSADAAEAALAAAGAARGPIGAKGSAQD